MTAKPSRAAAAEPVREAELFKLKTPVLSEGRLGNHLIETPLLRMSMKVYAGGGENTMHTHPYEDHAFVVMQGQATFHLETDDNTTVVNKNEGIMLPKGASYWFKSSAKENLVMLRVGAGEKPVGWRAFPDGSNFETIGNPENQKINKHVEPITVPGKFYFE